MMLNEIDPQNTFGQDVLNSAERVGLYLATLQENFNVTGEMVVTTNNLGEGVKIRECF